MGTSFLDKRPPLRWSFMVYWDCRASKFGDNLVKVPSRSNAFVENFENSVVKLKDNIAHAGANFKRRIK